jgi:hypothetical protein
LRHARIAESAQCAINRRAIRRTAEAAQRIELRHGARLEIERAIEPFGDQAKVGRNLVRARQVEILPRIVFRLLQPLQRHHPAGSARIPLPPLL